MKSVGFELDSHLLVSAKSKTKFQFNGREYAGADEMPASVRAVYDRAIGETPLLHSGARLAAKLNAKIILNDTEFNNPGEMSVDDRLLYHEALAAVFPASIAVSISEAPKIKPKKVWLIMAIVSIVAGAVYLWLHGLFG
ncbi:MAG: hypothetical protein DME60_00815 [Verrucomicrobia bacterium]|nr:MAG: hypothetical protein DME60_00815 [Verrucomicrobiota bacterium]